MHRAISAAPAALCRPLLFAAALGVTLLGTGCDDGERAAAERACAAEMPAAQPTTRGGYFHMNHGTSGYSETIISPGDDRTAGQLFMDTCMASRLNPGD